MIVQLGKSSFSRVRSLLINPFNTLHRNSQSSALKMSNRLKNEKSPYLLQHQHNPVDWHPWNPETLALAKSSGKPIFLSSGYSTCHWCHVMERESFENHTIAAVMNEHFINIKLDREEHPDIDRIYMSFIQAISGSGGWPMSVWMTPELKPFYGGTYFPPDERYYGRPGFKSLLLTLAEQWNENPDKCVESSTKVVEVMKKSAVLPVSHILPTDSGKKCLSQLARSFEPSFGGFSESPKFPQPVNLQFLIHFSKKEKDCFKMVDKTLMMMRKGGIYDHLGKGFSRYSTDKTWHVPHFEKMLYDQAQLATGYLNAYLVSKEEKFARVVNEILEYVSRDMSVEDGGFYSAEDADSLAKATSTEKKEGAFYVWEQHEIDEILKDMKLSNGQLVSKLFSARYGAKTNGNVDPHQDPHDELKKQNVLFEAKDYAKLATEFSIGKEEVESSLDSAKEKMFRWRNANRPRPHLDNKFIASWNGLMVQAYAQAGFALSNKSYVDRAVKAAQFIETNFYVNGDLLRTCYVTSSGAVVNLEIPIKGCVDDFANVIGAMLDVFQATGDAKYLKLAVKLQSKQDELFWDGVNGGYFNSRDDDPSVIVRMKDDDDGAEPSSNSTSLINLLRLNCIFPGTYLPNAEKILHQFAERVSKVPISLPLMTAALLSYQDGIKSVTVVGKKLQNSEILSALKKQLIPPGGIVIPVNLDSDLEELKKIAPLIAGKGKGASDEVVVHVLQGKKETLLKTVADVSKIFA